MFSSYYRLDNRCLFGKTHHFCFLLIYRRIILYFVHYFRFENMLYLTANLTVLFHLSWFSIIVIVLVFYFLYITRTSFRFEKMSSVLYLRFEDKLFISFSSYYRFDNRCLFWKSNHFCYIMIYRISLLYFPHYFRFEDMLYLTENWSVLFHPGKWQKITGFVFETALFQ